MESLRGGRPPVGRATGACARRTPVTARGRSRAKRAGTGHLRRASILTKLHVHEPQREGGSTGGGEARAIAPSHLLASIQRTPAPLVELILQAQTLLVGFDGADRLHDAVDPRLRRELTELAGRDGSLAGVVVRESRIPPDA